MTHIDVIHAFKQLSLDEKIAAISGIEAEWESNDLQKGSAFSLLDIVPDGIVGINEKGEIVLFNKQAEILFGYTREEVIGQWVEILMPKQYKKSHKELVSGYFHKPATRPMGDAKHDLLGLRKNGEKFAIDISLSYLDTATGQIAISAIRDTTEKKLTEEELKKSNNRYETLLKTTDEMMNSVSSDGKIVWANNAWKKNLLYNDDDTRDKMIIDVLSKETQEIFEENFKLLRSGETVSITSSKMVCKNGTEIDITGTIVPVFDDGKFAGTQSFLRNVTEINEERDKRNKIEDRFQWTLDNMFTGCMVLGYDWIFLYANKAIAEHIFSTPEILIGRTIQEMYPGVENSEMFSKFKHCMDERIRLYFEEKYQFPNGITKWFNVQVEPIVEGIFVLSIDITEKKIAEQNIHKNQELLKESQRIAHLGSWDLDIANNALYWSDEIYRIFEIDPKLFAASYEAFLDLVHPEDRDFVNISYNDAVTNKTPYDINHRIKLPDGRVKYLHEQAETFYDLNGTPINTVGTVHDITKQKQAEMLLHKNENKYQQVVKNITDGLMIDDIRGRVVFCNNQFLELFGLEEIKISNITLENYVSPEYVSVLLDRHNHRVAGEDVPDFFEFIGLHKDGHKVWCEVHVINVIENGKITGTQSIIRNITERKLADGERAKMIDDIIQRNKNLEQFSYMVSHNLRAPAATIMGIINFMKDPRFNKNDENEMVNGLYNSVNKLDIVIRDLNKILQIRQDENERKEIIRFDELVANIKLSMENLIKKENATITTNFFTVSEMLSIKSYLHSIFYNLILNSIKYRRETVDPVIEIISFRGKDSIEIVFKDNGIGIDLENNKDKIFGMYKRFHYHTEGKGLGLYMVKTQIESLGGKIYVDSEVNVGTTFKVSFDLKQK